MIYNNYCEFESKAIQAIKRLVAKRLGKFRSWKGMDLAPALERHLISKVINNRGYFEDFLEKETEIFFDRINREASKKRFLLRHIFSDIVVIKNLYRFLCYLLTPGKTKGCRKFLIVTHHKKFIHYFCSARLPTDKVSWLLICDEKSLSRTLPTKAHAMKLPFKQTSKKGSKSLTEFLNQVARMDDFFKANKPEFVICAEGDAPYHSLLSELGKMHSFKSVCLQWGVFYDGWRDIAFSNMRFDYFLTWGEYFSKDLMPANQRSKFISYGRLNIQSDISIQKKDKIVFLAQGVVGAITQKNFDDFFYLCIKTKKLLPQFEIIYRPHPSIPLEGLQKVLKKNGVIVDDNQELVKHLSQSIICVAITSSSLLEGVLVDSVPISFGSNCLRHAIDLEKNKIGVRLESVKAVLDLIKVLAERGEVYHQYLNNIKSQKGNFFSENGRDLTDFLEKL